MLRKTRARDASGKEKSARRSLAEVGEDGVIRYLRRRHRPSGSRVTLGIGDDAAIFSPPRGKKVVFTSDIMAEGVHFSLDTSSPEDLGFKLAAVNVSDIAAMGGRPTGALLSLALPGDTAFDFVRRLSAGLRAAEKKFGFQLLGGDTTASASRIFTSLALFGELRARRPLTRSGAAPGDRIYVTGHLGASVLGLAALNAGRGSPGGGPFQAVVRKHLRPVPPLAWGARLAERSLASAAMDLSDGLSTDLGRLCRESGVGAGIETALLPVRPATRKAAAALGHDAAAAALHGGEEYELLFTVRPGKVKAVERIAATDRSVKITRIGTVLDGARIFTVSPDKEREPLQPRGWRHFRD
jgi:thiamine-monophosphate kinase